MPNRGEVNYDVPQRDVLTSDMPYRDEDNPDFLSRNAVT